MRSCHHQRPKCAAPVLSLVLYIRWRDFSGGTLFKCGHSSCVCVWVAAAAAAALRECRIRLSIYDAACFYLISVSTLFGIYILTFSWNFVVLALWGFQCTYRGIAFLSCASEYVRTIVLYYKDNRKKSPDVYYMERLYCSRKRRLIYNYYFQRKFHCKTTIYVYTLAFSPRIYITKTPLSHSLSAKQ